MRMLATCLLACYMSLPPTRQVEAVLERKDRIVIWRNFLSEGFMARHVTSSPHLLRCLLLAACRLLLAFHLSLPPSAGQVGPPLQGGAEG